MGILSDCKFCGGTGYSPANLEECPDCKGKGRY